MSRTVRGIVLNGDVRAALIGVADRNLDAVKIVTSSATWREFVRSHWGDETADSGIPERPCYLGLPVEYDERLAEGRVEIHTAARTDSRAADHVLIQEAEGVECVNAHGIGTGIVVNVPLNRPLDLEDGRHVVSIGLDMATCEAIGAELQRVARIVS